MHVREARPDDADAVFEVHRAAIAELGPEAYDDEQVAAWGAGGSADDYEFESDGYTFVVAETDGRVVGFGSLRHGPSPSLESPADAEVTAVYVLPSLVRRGVGSRLLAAMETEAEERGFETVGLCSSLVAVPFYDANGYDRVADRTHAFSGGVEGRAVEMKREL